METILYLNQVSFNLERQYTFCPALNQIQIDIPYGKHTVFFHPGGPAHALILYLLAGLAVPESGCIQPSPKKEFCQLALLSIREQLLSWHTDCSVHSQCCYSSKTPLSDNTSLIKALFSGLPGEPSNRQQQLWIELIRLAANTSELLLLDRISRHFDRPHTEQYYQSLYEFRQTNCVSIVSAVCHLSEALLLADRIYLLGGYPVTVHTVYENPFTSELSPKERIQHPDYHRFYQELLHLCEQTLYDFVPSRP